MYSELEYPMVNTLFSSTVLRDEMLGIQNAIKGRDSGSLEKAILRHPSYACWFQPNVCKCDSCNSVAEEFYKVLLELDNETFRWLAQHSKLLPCVLNEIVDMDSHTRM